MIRLGRVPKRPGLISKSQNYTVGKKFAQNPHLTLSCVYRVGEKFNYQVLSYYFFSDNSADFILILFSLHVLLFNYK